MVPTALPLFPHAQNGRAVSTEFVFHLRERLTIESLGLFEVPLMLAELRQGDREPPAFARVLTILRRLQCSARHRLRTRIIMPIHQAQRQRVEALVHESKLTATIPTTDTSPAD